MIDQIHPELIVSSLRLLLEGYKLTRDRFKNKKVPEDIEKIVTKAEKDPKTIDAAKIERDLKETLAPEDAAIVKGDLEFLGLLMFPVPKLDAFDYWGMLTRLVYGLQSFAKANRLFDLRGMKQTGLGQVLVLHKAGPLFLPNKQAAKLPTPYNMQTLKDAKGMAVLRQEEGDGFPIVAAVIAEFYQYEMTGGTPSLERDSCWFDLGPGQQPHWLKFDRGQRFSPHFASGLQYMLEASDFMSIVKALHDDIHFYANAIRADEQKIRPLSAAIDAFVKANQKST